MYKGIYFKPLKELYGSLIFKFKIKVKPYSDFTTTVGTDILQHTTILSQIVDKEHIFSPDLQPSVILSTITCPF